MCVYVYHKFERDPSITSQVIANYISVALAVALSVVCATRRMIALNGYSIACLTD